MSNTIKEEVQRRYGQHALAVTAGRPGGCCGGSTDAGAVACCDPVTSDLYGTDEASAIPTEAVMASLGCGNPTALASLAPGETVLDLGSGGGIDVLLSARRVGPTGKAYGLDMTDQMLALAEENTRKSGLKNVEFLRGEIEHIPLPDNSVDVIISNCVINLSADKDQVLREAFRVLRPGAAWPSATSSRAGRSRPRSGAAWSSGSGASPAPWTSRTTSASCAGPGSSTRPSSPPAFTGPRTPGRSSTPRASTSTLSPPTWTRSSSAASSAPSSRIVLPGTNPPGAPAHRRTPASH